MLVCLRKILVVLLLFQGVAVVGAEEGVFSDEAEILLLAARNAVKGGHRDIAIQRYRTLVTRYPDVVEGHRELGWLLIQEGAREEGLTHVKRGMTSRPNDVRARVQLVEAYLLDQRFQEARQELDWLLSAFPNDVHVQAQLGNYYVHRRRFTQAQRLFETLLETSVDQESRMGLVQVALARGDLETAGRALADLTQRVSDDPYVQKAQVLFWGRQGRMASAYNGLSRIKEPSLQALTEAELLNVTGQYFSAETRFAQLIADQPRHYVAMMGLAYAYVGQRDDARAVAALQAVVDQFPEDLEARVILGEVLIHQRQWDAARTVVTELLQEEPDVLEVIYLNDRVHGRLGHGAHGGISTTTFHWWKDGLKSPAAAIRAKQQLARFDDLHGIRAASDPFIRDTAISAGVLTQWTNAMIRTGRGDEGVSRLVPLQKRQVQDQNLPIALATLYVYQGHVADAKVLLEQVPATFEKGALYQQMEESGAATAVFSEVVRQEADQTHAQIGVITSLAMAGQEAEARQALSQMFEQCPSEGWPALAGLLVGADGTTRPYQTLLQTELQRRGLDGQANSLDMRLAYASLLSQVGDHAEAVHHYQVFEREYPQRPALFLGLARSLVQDQASRSLHTYRPVVAAYDRYLELQPYDVAVWSEKARFLGWQSRYADAEKEYEALLAQYPEEETIRLELAGKQRFWRDHGQEASRRYQHVIALQPQHEEALSDLGQIQSARFRFLDSQPYYRRLLTGNPGHELARESLELTKVFARPQLTAGMGYVKMDGFDGTVLTKYLPVTAEIFAPFSQNVWAGVGYQWVKFDVPGKPSSANIGRVMARYSPSPFWHVDGYVGGLTYSGTNKSNVNFGAGVSYEWPSGLKGRIEASRQDLWQNAETIRRNLSYHTYAVGAEYQVTKELEFTAGAGFWDYSDDNWNVNGQFSGTYTLLPFPHPLRVTYQLDTFGFDEKSVYFSPEFFAKNTFAIGWQHFLGFPRRKEHHGESPMRNRYSGTDIAQYLGWPMRPVYLPKMALNAYSLDYGFSVDDENNLYHQLSASFAYAMTKRCHLHAVGMIIRANVVDQDSVNGFLQCHL